MDKQLRGLRKIGQHVTLFRAIIRESRDNLTTALCTGHGCKELILKNTWNLQQQKRGRKGKQRKPDRTY